MIIIYKDAHILTAIRLEMQLAAAVGATITDIQLTPEETEEFKHELVRGGKVIPEPDWKIVKLWGINIWFAADELVETQEDQENG